MQLEVGLKSYQFEMVSGPLRKGRQRCASLCDSQGRRILISSSVPPGGAARSSRPRRQRSLEARNHPAPPAPLRRQRELAGRNEVVRFAGERHPTSRFTAYRLLRTAY